MARRCGSGGKVGREEGKEAREEGGQGGKRKKEKGKIRTVVPERSQSAGSHISRMWAPRRGLPRGGFDDDGDGPWRSAASSGSSLASSSVLPLPCWCWCGARGFVHRVAASV